MQNQDEPSHAMTCHRCGMPMDFHAEEIIDTRRVAIFRCANCDTLEAVEQGTAA